MNTLFQAVTFRRNSSIVLKYIRFQIIYQSIVLCRGLLKKNIKAVLPYSVCLHILVQRSLSFDGSRNICLPQCLELIVQKKAKYGNTKSPLCEYISFVLCVVEKITKDRKAKAISTKSETQKWSQGTQEVMNALNELER